MYKSNTDITLFPIGESMDFSTFDKLDKDFLDWIKYAFDSRLNNLDSNAKSLQLWHINGSENRVTKNQTLFTFYELDEPTQTEVNLVKQQDKCIFSSKYAADQFKDKGCENAYAVPLGFDEDFGPTDKSYLKDRIHFGLMGKFEKRKHTAKIVKAWLKKYGNNYKYQLTCCITNPFIKPEQMNQILGQLLEGKHYGNINFLPFLKTNSEVNDFLNSIDIDLTGLSGAEGWNLPSFNSTCLGKWSTVLNCTSHKDWANSDNSILVEPEGKESAEDGMFFSKGLPFNQGNIHSVSEEKIVSAMELAEKKAKTKNTKGEELKSVFSYSNTLKEIIKIINP
tara:strand:- start:3783 stop:4793 length:1011 start_codon:yes stop_codon:yes gene_type:complete